jgi:hypothetical protein
VPRGGQEKGECFFATHCLEKGLQETECL